MKLKDALLEQFDSCYDQNGWFVAIKNAIHGITAEEAAWKPDGADNSIWQILSHLNYYNNAYLERFRGVDYEYDKPDNDATFEQAEAPSEAAWRAEVEQFNRIMSQFRDLLSKADDAKLDELAPPAREYPWSVIVSNINAHNAHHGGQIVLMRKLQGSWDRGKGVS
jgi:uncharacterized damage-inducible protein DinB